VITIHFQEAAKKPLPIIVPVYPTLRRMMRAERQAAAAEAAAHDSQHGTVRVVEGWR